MTDGWILWIRGSALTTCDSEEAMCPSPPSQCRTSGARYFLQCKRRRRVRKICVCSSQCLNDDDRSATDPWAQRSRPEEACRFQSQTAWAAVALRCRLLLPAAGEEVTPVSEHTLLTKQSIRWYVTLYQCENLWSAMLLLSIMNSRGKWIQKQGVCSCVTVPARTRWSVCCFLYSDDTPCSSASPAGLPPACRTAWPGSYTHK